MEHKPTAASPFAPAPDAAEDNQPHQIHFTPVPRLRVRRNGWTPARQRMFIAALAGCGSVSRAARSVGMTARSAYRLMDADGADSFAAAWDEAIETGIERVRADALERALHGAPVALFRRGKLVRVEQRRNDRLAIALLGGRDRGIDVYRRSAVDRREYYQELQASDAAKAEADEAKAEAARHSQAIAEEHRALASKIRADARRAKRRRVPAVEPRVRTL